MQSSDLGFGSLARDRIRLNLFHVGEFHFLRGKVLSPIGPTQPLKETRLTVLKLLTSGRRLKVLNFVLDGLRRLYLGVLLGDPRALRETAHQVGRFLPAQTLDHFISPRTLTLPLYSNNSCYTILYLFSFPLNYLTIFILLEVIEHKVRYQSSNFFDRTEHVRSVRTSF